MKICSVPGCDRKHNAHGLCDMHRSRLQRRGTTDGAAAKTTEERFWEKVDMSGDCWTWIASRQPSGYGKFYRDGRLQVAHRVAYELLVGTIPEGLHLDHLCRNHACVNPDHLEPVTPAENMRRGVSPIAFNGRKTHCLRGHALSGENVSIGRGGRKRSCRTCWREKARAKAQRTRELAQGVLS